MESGAAWRRWLRQHQGSSAGVWVLFYKADSGRQRLTYETALEEALCMGWTDFIVKRIDDESYLQKFTPRRHGSDWSLPNRNRARRLQKEGRMMPRGLAAAGAWIYKPEESAPDPAAEPAAMPQKFVQARSKTPGRRLRTP